MLARNYRNVFLFYCFSDIDYYSESDEEGETTSTVSESSEVASNSSSSAGRNGPVTKVDGVNGDVARMTRFHTTSELVRINAPESPRICLNSNTSKMSSESSLQTDVSSAIQNNDDVISETVTPEKITGIRQNGLSSKSMKISRSMNSLFVSEKPSNFLAASYEKARDRASRWVSSILKTKFSSTF